MKNSKILLFFTIVSLAGCILFPKQGYSNWREDLQKIISMEELDNDVITHIFQEKPTYDKIITELQTITFQKTAKDQQFMLYTFRGSDDVDRPFIIYVPSGYDPANPTPVLVYLHGGVGRKEIRDEPLEYAKQNGFISWAEKMNWFVLFPFGQAGATWWDSVGLGNILGQIIFMKRNFNIDDDLIAVTGFSDGASGSFGLALLKPDMFSSFLPLNGHIGVASLDGKQPSYVTNLKSTPLHVINTDLDELYPHHKILPMINVAYSAGADIEYKVYYGIGHDFDYHDQEIPQMISFIERHPRNPFPIRIDWESSRSEFGRRLWLQIDEIDKNSDQQEWHKNYNLTLSDERVSFGFFHDETFSGPGVKISTLVESEHETLCQKLGLKPGDVLLAADGTEFADIDGLTEYKKTKKRGDQIELTILRDNKKQILKGEFPPPHDYNLFIIEKSGRIKACRLGNRIDLTSSRVKKCSIYIHPAMYQIEKPITVFWNDQKIYDDVIKPDPEFTLKYFLENRDRKVIYCNKISLQLALDEETNEAVD